MTSKKQRILNQKLKEQITILKKRMSEFDRGDELEIFNIATIVRVLVHDTRNSHSLLNQLGIKDNIYFHSFASKYCVQNMMSYTGLVGIRMETGTGLSFIGVSKTIKNDPEKKINLLCHKFDDWWTEVVIDDKKKQFSREDLVLFLVNKGGGAHIDLEIDDNIFNLHYENSIGWKYVEESHNGTIEINPINNLIYVTVFEIARELLISIENYYAALKYNINESVALEYKAYKLVKNNNCVFVHFKESNVFTDMELDERNYDIFEKQVYNLNYTYGSDLYHFYLIK